MRAILIPVKNLSNVKQRLASMLTMQERSALAGAMMEDTFAAVARVRSAERVFVVTNEQRAMELARRNRWHVIEETGQESESASVDSASRFCAAQGVTALLRLPIDLPLLTPGDVESVWAELLPAPSAVLAPSRDGTGTNALLRAPAPVFASRFGPGSFVLHLEGALAAGAAVKVMSNARLAFDVDDPVDLRDLRSQPGIGPATARWMKSKGLCC